MGGSSGCRPVPAMVLAAGMLLFSTGKSVAQASLAPGPVPTLTVRGTVEAIDLRHVSFVLRVQTHTRIIYLTEYTDTTGLGRAASGLIPVQPNERVTVGGFLQPNGTVLGGLLTHSIQRDYQPPPGVPDRILFGMISGTSDKLRGRDIKLRAADGTEIKVKVGRGVPVARAGQPISVHDLSRRDETRIVGTQDGTDLKAARVDVLPAVVSPASVTVPPPASPTRPGL